jgi:hypothetical protein
VTEDLLGDLQSGGVDQRLRQRMPEHVRGHADAGAPPEPAQLRLERRIAQRAAATAAQRNPRRILRRAEAALLT